MSYLLCHCPTIPAPACLHLHTPTPPQVYFRLNTITNCKNVVKQADTLNIFDSTEASNRVTFR
jgi:hypothetical protein